MTPPVPAAGSAGTLATADRAWPPPQPILVLWNRSAGSKAGMTVTDGPDAADLERQLRVAGIPAEVHETATAESAEAAVARAVAEDAPVVVAAGGDGTVRAVARALLAAGAASGRDAARLPALAILPLGSVMNVARSLGVPRELEGAIAVLAGGHLRTVDAVRIAGGDTFLEGVVVGLHAELFAEAAAFDEGDRLAPLRGAWTALRYQPSRISLEAGGRRVATRALVVTVSNGPYVGLGFTVAPAARLDDGLLDVRVFERFSRWELLRHFWAIALGRRRYEPRVRTIRVAAVRVAGASSLRVRADGEDAGTTPVTVEAVPGALRVVVPAPDRPELRQPAPPPVTG